MKMRILKTGDIIIGIFRAVVAIAYLLVVLVIAVAITILMTAVIITVHLIFGLGIIVMDIVYPLEDEEPPYEASFERWDNNLIFGVVHFPSALYVALALFGCWLVLTEKTTMVNYLTEKYGD